jgi:hypothetical protein
VELSWAISSTQRRAQIAARNSSITYLGRWRRQSEIRTDKKSGPCGLFLASCGLWKVEPRLHALNGQTKAHSSDDHPTNHADLAVPPHHCDGCPAKTAKIGERKIGSRTARPHPPTVEVHHEMMCTAVFGNRQNRSQSNRSATQPYSHVDNKLLPLLTTSLKERTICEDLKVLKPKSQLPNASRSAALAKCYFAAPVGAICCKARIPNGVGRCEKSMSLGPPTLIGSHRICPSVTELETVKVRSITGAGHRIPT